MTKLHIIHRNTKESSAVEKFSICCQTNLSIPSAPHETPAEFRELHRSPWKRARQNNEIYERSVKRAKVIEVVVKDEVDIMDNGVRYFPVNLSCGGCPTSLNTTDNNEEVGTKLQGIKVKSTRLVPRMRAKRRVADSRKLPFKKTPVENPKIRPNSLPTTKSDIGQKQPVCSKDSKRKPVGKLTLCEEVSESLYRCATCGRTYTDQKILDRHMTSHKRTATSKVLRGKRHLIDSAKDSSKRLASDSGKSQVSRTMSREKFPKVIGLKQPIVFDSSRKFKCQKCKYSSNSPQEFWLHIKGCITDEYITKCCFCSKKFPRTYNCNRALSKHIERMHCVRKCLSCSSLVSQVARQSHSLSHMSQNDKNCYLCDFSSDRVSNLGKHISERHFESTEILDVSSIPDSNGYFHCSLCDYQTYKFNTMPTHYTENHDTKSSENRHHEIPSDKDRHITNMLSPMKSDGEVYTGEFKAGDSYKDFLEAPKHNSNVFECPGCNKEFNSMCKLWDHAQSSCAWTMSPKKCCFCPKAVNDRLGLERHVKRSHFMRKCDSCDKLLSQLDALPHLESHGLKKLDNKFLCYGCHLTFTKKQDLLSHVVSEHLHITKIFDSTALLTHSEKGDAQWQCVKCNITFDRKYILMKHRSKEHQIVPYDEIITSKTTTQSTSRKGPPSSSKGGHCPKLKQSSKEKSLIIPCLSADDQPNIMKLKSRLEIKKSGVKNANSSISTHVDNGEESLQSLDFSCKICGHCMTSPSALYSHIRRLHHDSLGSRKVEAMHMLCKRGFMIKNTKLKGKSLS